MAKQILGYSLYIIVLFLGNDLSLNKFLLRAKHKMNKYEHKVSQKNTYVLTFQDSLRLHICFDLQFWRWQETSLKSWNLMLVI